MRSILRAVGRTARVFLWIVKGLLLVLAVGAVVMWPVSRGRVMAVSAGRYRAGPALGDWRMYSAGCWDGRAVLFREWGDARVGSGLALIREEVQSSGDDWRWEQLSNASDWDEGDWPSRWGLLRWHCFDNNSPKATYHRRYVAAPLWLVALAAGAWPVASIALLIRRRRKQRRLALVGCCQTCGYDLRATAAAGGPLMPRCPECGAESAAAQRKED